MPRATRTNRQRARDSQVGILMRAYRNDYPNNKGGKGISQTELLRLMGQISPYYGMVNSHVAVSKWESGDTPATRERLETFARALDLSDAEAEGLIAVADLDEEPNRRTALSCPDCGEKTVTHRSRNSGITRAIPEHHSNITVRTRRCVACGLTAESNERWAHDPADAEHPKLYILLGQIQAANEEIREALTEANALRTPQNGLPEETAPPAAGTTEPAAPVQ